MAASGKQTGKPAGTPPGAPIGSTAGGLGRTPGGAPAGRPSASPDGSDGSDELGAPHNLPGSRGEHLLQCAYGSRDRALRFYNDQVLDHLNPEMIAFVGRMEMAFVSTADALGECDASLRAGPPGFIQVINERQLAYPEYRGNGVMASLGNISENPHIGILMVDFVTDLIGLHVNGKARIMEDEDLRAEYPALPTDFDRGRTPERWVVVEVVEAYIHCRKHIPRMVPVARTRSWGTDDIKRKGGDYFSAKGTPRPWYQPAATSAPTATPPMTTAAATPMSPASPASAPAPPPAPVRAAPPAPAATSGSASAPMWTPAPGRPPGHAQQPAAGQRPASGPGSATTPAPAPALVRAAATGQAPQQAPRQAPPSAPGSESGSGSVPALRPASAVVPVAEPASSRPMPALTPGFTPPMPPAPAQQFAPPASAPVTVSVVTEVRRVVVTERHEMGTRESRTEAVTESRVTTTGDTRDLAAAGLDAHAVVVDAQVEPALAPPAATPLTDGRSSVSPMAGGAETVKLRTPTD